MACTQPGAACASSYRRTCPCAAILCGMDDRISPQRRRLLFAALGATALVPLTAVRATASPAQPLPDFKPWGEGARPDLFLTLSSPARDAAALEAVLRAVLLPALAAADIAHVHGPIAGAIQLWMQIEPDQLLAHGLDAATAVAKIAEAVGGQVMPVPGRNRLQAWALVRPQAAKAVGIGQTVVPLPGIAHATLGYLGRTVYTLLPPQWDGQAAFSVYLESRTRLLDDVVQRCEQALQAATELPQDVQIQLGRMGRPLDTVTTLYVDLLGDRDG